MTEYTNGQLCLESHIGSVFENEQELLKSVIRLHCPNGIELDPMYFKGNFYKDISRPKLVYDIEPKFPFVEKVDAQELPISDNIVETMVLDPPFLFGIHGKTESYYSSSTHGIFKNFTSLYKLYHNILSEAFRVLKNKGILIFKTLNASCFGS